MASERADYGGSSGLTIVGKAVKDPLGRHHFTARGCRKSSLQQPRNFNSRSIFIQLVATTSSGCSGHGTSIPGVQQVCSRLPTAAHATNSCGCHNCMLQGPFYIHSARGCREFKLQRPRNFDFRSAVNRTPTQSTAAVNCSS